MSSDTIGKSQLYVYELDSALIDTFRLVEFEESIEEYIESLPEKTEINGEDDFTKFNKAREIQGLPKLTEEEFGNKLEQGSVGSISGSESEYSDAEDEELYERMDETKISDIESENDNLAHLRSKTPMVYFSSTKLPSDKHLGVFKSLFNEKELSNPITALKAWNMEQGKGKSALIMLGGGHFAAAIISHKRKSMKGNVVNKKIPILEQEVEVIKSKTFHRYTTRRKQGGSQSANDNAKGNAKSVGSTIRRQMEQQLIVEIRELLKSWEHDLKDCSSIYIKANGFNGRKTLMGYEGAPIPHGDKRVKNFPFSTRRATASELKRAWTQLAYLTVSDSIKQDEKLKQKLLQQRESLIKSQQQKEVAKKEVSESDKHTAELIQFCKRQKAPLLITYLKKNNLATEFELSPSLQYKNTPTLLHYCSSQGLTHMVQVLLVNLKADPTVQNKAGRVAAELCANQQTKYSFQISRSKLGESSCNWEDAKVQEPKTKEEVDKEEAENAARETEKKKQQLKEELARKTEMELKKPTFSSNGSVGGPTLLSDMSGLNEQQKMRLMREQRARAAEARFKKVQG